MDADKNRISSSYPSSWRKARRGREPLLEPDGAVRSAIDVKFLRASLCIRPLDHGGIVRVALGAASGRHKIAQGGVASRQAPRVWLHLAGDTKNHLGLCSWSGGSWWNIGGDGDGGCRWSLSEASGQHILWYAVPSTTFDLDLAPTPYYHRPVCVILRLNPGSLP